MKIVRETNDELDIHVSAKSARVVGSIFVIVGVLFSLPFIIPLLSDIVRDQFITGKSYMWPFLLIGILFAAPGVAGWLKIRATDYRFDRKQRRISIQTAAGETIVPFANVLKAEVAISYGGHRVRNTYGLRLVLRNPGEITGDESSVLPSGTLGDALLSRESGTIDITPVFSADDSHIAECKRLAEKINKMIAP